jgi:hypothetical protein
MDTAQLRQMASEMREHLTGCSLSQRPWFGATKSFDDEATVETASRFGADAEWVSGRNPILDTAHPAYKALSTLKTSIRTYWLDNTMPYVVPGVRLITRERMPVVRAEVAEIAARIPLLVDVLDAARDELINDARNRLGRLFRDFHYPDTFHGKFSSMVEERAIDPPHYLMHSNAEEYQRQIAARLADISASIEKYQAEQWRGLAKLAGRLAEVLNDPSPDGKNRIQAANLDAFQRLFDHSARLNFSGTAAFQAATVEVKELLATVSVQELRTSRGLRAETREKLTATVGRFEELRTRLQIPDAVVSEAQPVVAIPA